MFFVRVLYHGLTGMFSSLLCVFILTKWLPFLLSISEWLWYAGSLIYCALMLIADYRPVWWERISDLFEDWFVFGTMVGLILMLPSILVILWDYTPLTIFYVFVQGLLFLPLMLLGVGYPLLYVTIIVSAIIRGIFRLFFGATITKGLSKNN